MKDQTGNVKINTKHCPECGSELHETQTTCDSCGAVQENENAAGDTKFCHECGNEIHRAAEKCEYCGAAQQADVDPPASKDEQDKTGIHLYTTLKIASTLGFGVSFPAFFLGVLMAIFVGGVNFLIMPSIIVMIISLIVFSIGRIMEGDTRHKN